MSSTRRRNLWGYSRRRREATLEEVSYLDVIIKIKEQNKWKVDTVDTGLCYLYSEPVYYLKDEFNRIAVFFIKSKIKFLFIECFCKI